MIVRELFAKFGLTMDQGSFVKASLAVEGIKRGAEILVQTLQAVPRALVRMVDESIEAGSRINDLSEKIGVSAETLQSYGYAVGLAGVGSEDFAQALTLLGRKAGDAAMGSAEAAKSFASVGISLTAANGRMKTTEQLMLDVSDVLKNTADPGKRAAIAMDLFGRSGAAMIPALKGGRREVEALAQEARELGLVNPDAMIKAFDETGDQIGKVSGIVKALKMTLSAEFLPIINRVVEKMLSWWKANRTDVIEKLTSVIDTATGAVETFFDFLEENEWVLEAIEAALKGLAFVGGVLLVGAMAGGLKAFIAFAAPIAGTALAVGALSVLIGILAEEIVAMFTDTDGFFEKMQGRWSELGTFLTDSIKPDDFWLVKGLKHIGSWVAKVFSFIDALFAGLADIGVFVSDLFYSIPNAVAAIGVEVKKFIKDHPWLASGINFVASNFGGSAAGTAASAVQSIAGPAIMQPSAAARGRGGDVRATSQVTISVDARGNNNAQSIVDGVGQASRDGVEAAHQQTFADLTPLAEEG